MPAIRCVIYTDGRTTVSGVDYRILRQALTAAALHFYDSVDKTDPQVKKYAKDMLREIKLIEDAVSIGIKNTFPKYENKPTKAQRLLAVKDKKHTRELIDSIVEDALAAQAERVKQEQKDFANKGASDDNQD